jgi:2-oxo-hept-3-ene-1,7-dioate hydratase
MLGIPVSFASRLAAAAALLWVSGCASLPDPECPADPRVAQVAADWLQKRPQQKTNIAISDAICFRKHFLQTLAPKLGPVVGYKVGIYTKAGQRTFGTTEPAIGVLHRNMIVDEGAPVSVSYGYSPLAEADFVLVVKDDGINGATTREEAFRHLRGYRPFIELPDNNFPAGTKVTAGELIALNVNARMGMVGREIALPQTPEAMEGLTNLSAELTVEGAAGLERAEGKALTNLGDPLQIVLFAKDALLREGGRLKAGDLISLGTLMPARTPRAGDRMRVRYRVLAEPSEILISFVQ